jgi:DNA-directed RNA polymerase subunit RPC12/RpoP
MKATKQRKTSSRKERVGSPSIPPDASVDDAPPVAAASGKEAGLEAKPTSSDVSGSNPQLGLVDCPECGQRALFWNRHDRIYRCVNPECKRAFTLEEYRNKEVGKLPEEQQTEQMPSNELITEVTDEIGPSAIELMPSNEAPVEATDKMELGATEQIPCNGSIANENIEPGVTEQMSSKESITEAADNIEPGVTEQMSSKESITEAADNMEPNATEQMPSNVSAAEVKDEIERGKIEETSSDVPTTEAKDEGKEGAKAGKQMNRNLAFLLIGLLAIGIVVLVVFLGQKSGNLDELASQLDKSRQALTQSQTELAASQQDVEGLRTQLAEAQQEVEALQAEINELKPLTPSGPFVYSGELAVGDQISIPIELKESERVEGTITGGLGGLAVYIQDSGGSIAEDLGRVFRSSFTFTAQTSGRYNIVIKGPNELTSKYNLEYTIYRRQ